MLSIVIKRTRPDLTPDQCRQLDGPAPGFGDHIPHGVTLRADYAANDRSRTVTPIERDDPALLKQSQARFRRRVEIERVPVTAIFGRCSG